MVGKIKDFDAIWIGYNDIAQEGNFTWIDGTETKYTKWGTDEPNNNFLERGEDCGEIDFHQNGTWNDENCLRKRPFICKFRHGLLQFVTSLSFI